MHELGVTFYIVKGVKEAAEENQVKTVSSVTVEVGEVTGVIPEYLIDCWNWAKKKEPVTENAELRVEKIDAVTYCEDCAKTYPTMQYGKTCPYCGSGNTYLVQGREFLIKEIVVEDEEQGSGPCPAETTEGETMYTLENSINDVLKDDLFRKHASYVVSADSIDIVPDALRDEPMSILREKVKMPWGAPYTAEDVVLGINTLYRLEDKERYSFVKLWAEETPDDFYPAIDGTKDGVGLLIYKETFKSGNPIALIVPGGAYIGVAVPTEGLLVADVMAAAGYAVAILNYRCAPNHYPAPQEDMALAIKFLRKHVDETGVNAENLLAIGFSAGGHLVASETNYPEEADAALMAELKDELPGLYKAYEGISVKPDKVCLAYPVISTTSEVHFESAENISGGDPEMKEHLSIEKHVDASYPKTFIWACDDDDCVPPSNSSRMAMALEAAGVEYLYRTYPIGGHGINVGVGTSAYGWMDTMIEFMR